jgi:uncharacterized protein YbjQ (UPF0145 family)
MITTSTDTVPNKEIKEILGIVRGNTVRAKHIGKDIFAGLQSIVGGELDAYTALLNEARQQAEDRMILEATKLNADAIVTVRITTSQVKNTASEILVYGTAVKFA